MVTQNTLKHFKLFHFCKVLTFRHILIWICSTYSHGQAASKLNNSMHWCVLLTSLFIVRLCLTLIKFCLEYPKSTLINRIEYCAIHMSLGYGNKILIIRIFLWYLTSYVSIRHVELLQELCFQGYYLFLRKLSKSLLQIILRIMLNYIHFYIKCTVFFSTTSSQAFFPTINFYKDTHLG